jgi:hypothetical protein
LKGIDCLLTPVTGYGPSTSALYCKTRRSTSFEEGLRLHENTLSIHCSPWRCKKLRTLFWLTTSIITQSLPALRP